MTSKTLRLSPRRAFIAAALTVLPLAVGTTAHASPLAPDSPAYAATARAAQNPAQNRCSPEGSTAQQAIVARDAQLLETADADPRSQLQDLVRRALDRSRAIGAQRMIFQAAEADLADARAQRQAASRAGGTPAKAADNRDLALQGRITKLAEWRSQLAEGARFNRANAEEQIALQTVSLALDRGRYQLQAQVYSQYTRKMACLVDALDLIAKADRSRAPELAQAQKGLQQADQSYEQTVTALRETEARLKRFVGEQLPRSAGMSSVLSQLPALEEAMADIALSADATQASAEAQAQRNYAEAVRAGQQPSLGVAGVPTQVGQPRQTTNANDWMSGVTVNVAIASGTDAALTSASRRAMLTSQQRDEAIEAKRYLVQEMFAAAQSSLERSRRLVDKLRNSERPRGFNLQQWQQQGQRPLSDVMASDGDYYSMRIAHVNALYDAEQVVAIIWSQGSGVATPLR